MLGRKAQPSWFFALVVVRHEGRFLIVQEKKHGQQWYLPAGRVEPGESLMQGALRETEEESGLQVELTGVLRVEHTPSSLGSVRVRVYFLAQPKPGGSTVPRATPNEHSLRSTWVSLSDLNHFELRGQEVREVFEYVDRGGTVAPLSLLTEEGAPWPPAR